MQKLKQQQLFDRVFDRLPDHVTLLLIIISGFLLARLTWMMFPSDPSITAQVEREQNEPTGVAVIPAHATPKNLGNEIASYHLLGVYQPPKVAPPSKPAKKTEAPKPKPREALSLVGVYALNEKEGVAVINVKGKQEVVGVGESIGDAAATLKKVYANRVDVVWDDGEVATLEMPNINRSALGAIQIPPEQQLQQQPDPVIQPASFEQPDIQNQGIDQPVAPDQYNNSPASDTVDPQLQGGLPVQQRQPVAVNTAGRAPTAATATKHQKPAGAAVSLSDFKQEIINNNINLLQVIRPSPRKKNGQLIGFAVRPGTNRALFNQTGLQAGDVVTEINGMALTNNRVSRQAMQSLATASSATLTVLRGGQPTTVQLRF
ncbi:MAG: hypothetical protein CSA79_05440 [Thiothrix nivea]|nr:MAG: hypothetical protein CSA79_05440 [Thiothrix nivea]